MPILSIITDLVAVVTSQSPVARSEPEGTNANITLTPRRITQGKNPTKTTEQNRAIEKEHVTSTQGQSDSSTATTAALKVVSSMIQYAGLTNDSGTIAVANSTKTAITKSPLPRRQWSTSTPTGTNQQHQNGNSSNHTGEIAKSFNHTNERANSLAMSDPVVIQNKNVAIGFSVFAVIAIIIIIFTGLYLKFGRR